MAHNEKLALTMCSSSLNCSSILWQSITIITGVLIVAIATSSSASTSDGNQHSHDVISAARCRVRCLSLLQIRSDRHLIRDEENSLTLMNCLRQVDCTNCLKPCNQLITEEDNCIDICSSNTQNEDDEICVASCRFLQQIRIQHLGTCPTGHLGSSQLRSAALEARDSCTHSCTSDFSCDSSLKCCPTSCGLTCVRPLPFTDNRLPPVPAAPTIRERPREGSIELRWSSAAPSSTEVRQDPVLYVVDSRWNVGQAHAEFDMTLWQQVAQTSNNFAIINDFTPGHWYQFRVSAVNVHGSNGPSPPTEPFSLSKDPQRPGPPTNLTEGDTLIMGGKMAVTLHWFPPQKSDLPISRYKLFWSKRGKSTGSVHHQQRTSREFRQVLPGHRLVFQIPNLEPATTYFVEVQAICHYGDQRLKSEKAGLYITTYPVPHISDAYAESLPNSRSLPAPASILNLTFQPPFYQNGILKANVSWRLSESQSESDMVTIYWSAEACITDGFDEDDISRTMSSSTEERSYVIYDLRPDCRYLIRVQAVSERGLLGEEVVASLPTPSCGQAPIIDIEKPDCLVDVPAVPGEPMNLRHSFVIVNSNTTSKISWEDPPSRVAITAYRVVWGKLLRMHHSDPTMDKSTAITKVLSHNEHTLTIGNLEEGTTYLVRVQALSRIGAGQLATVQFTTPLFQSKPNELPFYKDLMAPSSNDNRKSDNKRKQEPVTTQPILLSHIEPAGSTVRWHSADWNNLSSRRSVNFLLTFLSIFIPVLFNIYC